MSEAPNPYSLPSRALSANGSLCQSAASYGTVSVWPASTSPPSPLP
jgi:hypothetical protein